MPPSQGGDTSSKLVLVTRGTYHPFDASPANGMTYTFNRVKCGSNDTSLTLCSGEKEGTVRRVKNREADALTLG